MTRKRLCFITTVPMAVSAFLRLHIERLANDHDVFVISNYEAESLPQDARVTYLSVPLAREISPVVDLKTLCQLVRLNGCTRVACARVPRVCPPTAPTNAPRWWFCPCLAHQ